MEALLKRSDDPTLADLVTLDEDDWAELARESGVPPEEGITEEEHRSRYGRRLARKIERMHPTAFLRDRIASERIPVGDEVRSPLDDFLAANPRIRFGEEPVLNVLAEPDLDPPASTGNRSGRWARSC